MTGFHAGYQPGRRLESRSGDGRARPVRRDIWQPAHSAAILLVRSRDRGKRAPPVPDRRRGNLPWTPSAGISLTTATAVVGNAVLFLC